MKQLNIILIVAAALILTGCGNTLKSVTLMAEDEILEKMNQTYKESFSVIDSKTVDTNSKRNITVTLSSPDYPEKVFTVFGVVLSNLDCDIEFDDSDVEFELTDLDEISNQNARMTVPYYHAVYYTDYYCQIYEEDFRNYLTEKFGTILEDTEYKLAVKTSIYDTSVGKIYDTAEKFISEIVYADAVFLVNKNLDSEEERKFNILAYSLTENPIKSIEPVFYFTTKYSVASVSDAELLSGTFYSEGDTEVTKKIVKFE